jgi:GntR family transcriptional repressor for pyruvate dehydrogenase complex
LISGLTAFPRVRDLATLSRPHGGELVPTRSKVEVSIIRRAVAELRDLILARPHGEFLGSEEDLIRQIEVSRPTFRQAAKLLEQEQLLVIKRGVGGGYFVRLPTTAGVSHAAAIYLYTRQANVEHVVRTGRPILAEIARVVALDPSPKGRKRLRKFLAQDALRPSDDVQGFLIAEREFVRLLASCSPNPVLELFGLVLVEFGTTFHTLRADVISPELIAARRVLRDNLIRAILEQDAEIAVLMSHRRTDAIIEWMHTDAKSRGGKGLAHRVQVGKGGVRFPSLRPFLPLGSPNGEI